MVEGLVIDINKWEVYYGLAINGLFTGIGATIGTYLAQNHVINKTKKLFKKKESENEDKEEM